MTRPLSEFTDLQMQSCAGSSLCCLQFLLLRSPPAICDPRRYSADWGQAAEEEARTQRERHEREAAEREAKARENWHGPRWWEVERV
jgi:hypothetical protein